MSVAVVTGTAGLIGAQAVKTFAKYGLTVVGIDNDMRRTFFGEEGSTRWQQHALERSVPEYHHVDADIRDHEAVQREFRRYGRDIDVVIHCAGQPLHDWAASAPLVDFTVNANGTLNLLEAARTYSPAAVFIFTSTNKVYSDRPNTLPLVELETRYEVASDHPYASHGIDESSPSTRASTASSVPRRSLPTCSYRSTGATSACRPVVFEGAASQAPGTPPPSTTGFSLTS
jgi:CDP-paratose 2-epimerase